MSRRALLCLGCLLIVGVSWAREGESKDATAAHQAVLKAAGLGTDGPALLDFFRKRTLTEEERARLSRLVRQLGADTFDARNKASADLVAAGRKSIPFLERAAADPDREIVRRVRRCLREIEATPETPLIQAAAALLATTRPAGAAEVLLAYLPFLEEENAEPALWSALQAVGVKVGKIDPALSAAIKGKAARQRSAAAWVIGRLPKADDRALVLPLLVDPEPVVRFRAAEALLAGKDKRGVPALLALLEKGPLETASESETLLGLLAGEKSPTVALGDDPEQRKKCGQAWRQWWKAEGAKLDLAKLASTNRLVGRRLVVALGGYGGNGAVWEYGADHKNRWQLRGVGGPFDCRVLPGGRVLIAEYNSHRVTERDLNNKVLWEYSLANGPLEVQRLSNGNTLIATNFEILEVTRAKTVVFRFADKSGNIFSAQKLANGHILYGLYTGSIVEIDRTGKELHRFGVERPRGLANIEVLPGGRYLMPCRTAIGSSRWTARARCCARCRWCGQRASPCCRAATCWSAVIS